MKIVALEAYKLFFSIKLHFTRKSFDYFKSGGRVKITNEGFSARKDKFVFSRLAKKYDYDSFVDLTLSNVLKNDSLWSMNLLEPEAEENLKMHQKLFQALTYNFRQDLNKIKDWVQEHDCSIDHILDPGNSYPPLLTMTLQNNISLESLVIINSVINFLPMWNRHIKDEIIWPKFALKMVKYTPFVLQKIDLKNMKNVIKNELFS